jgi:hypothetical protein
MFPLPENFSNSDVTTIKYWQFRNRLLEYYVGLPEEEKWDPHEQCMLSAREGFPPYRTTTRKVRVICLPLLVV